MDSLIPNEEGLFTQDDFDDNEDYRLKKKKKRKSFLEIMRAFLGYCPLCDGEVYGAVDSAKCVDCGWNNRNSK